MIADVLAGTRHSHRVPPTRKAAADVRDRTLVFFGMASALRRSELVALTVADLEQVPDGLRVRVVRSKTDQEGRGVVIAVPDGRRLNPVAHVTGADSRAGVVALSALA